MMKSKLEKWLGYKFSSGCTTGEDYKKFQRAAKSELKKMATENGMTLHKFNPNHYEFSAVLKDTESDTFMYVSISDVRFFPDEWYREVLYRTMKHDHDWTGGHNNYCCWPELGECTRRLMDRQRKAA